MRKTDYCCQTAPVAYCWAMQITPLGDTALIVAVGGAIDEPTHQRVQAALRALEAPPLSGVVELVPAYTTVTLFYDPLRVLAAGAPAEDIAGWLAAQVRQRLENPPQLEETPARTIEVPVCYGGDFGSDLAAVEAHTKLPAEEIVELHQDPEYLVYLIGFSPGFPYMGGLPARLSMPRRASPRTAVPPGSVGIVNDQTCIYPLATPGGWNLIGRTPLRLFRPLEDPPVLLRAGDRVKFRAITREEFARLEALA